MAVQVFNRLRDNAYLLLTGSALFWAGNFVIARGMHEAIPPLTLAALRWLFASLLFLPFALQHLRRDADAIRAHFPILLVQGGIGVGLFNTLSYIGLNHTTALNGLIIQSVGPVLILLAARALFGDAVSRRQTAGVATSLAGVFVIVSRGDPSAVAALRFNAGDLLILVAMLVWALYTVLLRRCPPIHAASFLAVTFILGALVNAPLALYEHLYLRQLAATPASLATIAYVSVFPSILAYLLWNRGVALIGSGRAGAFLHLVPLFGSLMAVLFLAEAPALFHALGFALIIAGVTIAARRSAP